jgi:cell division control protein 6
VDRFHFAKDQEFYCLPGEENMPGNNQFAQEGISYFSSIEALRKNLCAYGLPESIKALSDEEKVDINRWVRYVHISDLGDGAHINEDLIDPTIQKQAWTWLQQLGFKYASGYVIPQSATHPFKKFERAEDFYTYLARFGIPRCDHEPGPPLDEVTRLRLDLFVYNPGKHLDTL